MEAAWDDNASTVGIVIEIVLEINTVVLRDKIFDSLGVVPRFTGNNRNPH